MAKPATAPEKPTTRVETPDDVGGHPASTAGESEWLSESHSVMDAVAETPADTTVHLKDSAASVVEGEDGRSAEDRVEVSPTPSDDVESYSAATVAERVAGGATPSKKKDEKHAPATRKKSIQAEIDDLTYRRETLRRETETEEARLRTLRTSVAPSEVAAKPGATVDETKGALGNDPRPARPKYKDFDDLEKFDDATAQWEADDVAWMTRREARLRSEIEQGFDARLKSADADRFAEQADRDLSARVRSGKKAFEDFDAKVAHVKDLRSSWYRADRHGDALTPFLSDVTANGQNPAAVLYLLGSLAAAEPEKAQQLADLLPTRPIRDAILASSSPEVLLEHFASDEGGEEFDTIKGMPPARQIMALGALEARLADASDRGPSAGAPAPITGASPSAKPPVGSPRARAGDPANKPFVFDEWMRDEDAKELEERKKLLGVTA